MPPIKIAVADLCPGMYVIDSHTDWSKEPFLYSKEGIIRSADEIATILQQGYTEAYYDPDQSNIVPKEEISIANGETSIASPPSVELAEEFPIATQAYTDCVKHARNFMQSVRDGGDVHIDQAEPLITNIIGSLNRNMDALTSLAKVKTYDEYTFQHCVNVSIYATAFGRFLGLNENDLLLLGMAGIFHDTGKMRVPQDILNAPRRLTDEEFSIMKTHVRLGLECLEQAKGISARVIHGIGQHHEKFNGGGYPDGLTGDQISYFGRILSVADIYDALTAKRVYKDPMPPHKALSIMFGMRSETWPSGLVEQFIKMLGIYPVGTPVLLGAGFKAIVSQSNAASPLYPTVLVISDPQGQRISPPREINLSKHKNIAIKQVLTASESAEIDIAAVLSHAA